MSVCVWGGGGRRGGVEGGGGEEGWSVHTYMRGRGGWGGVCACIHVCVCGGGGCLNA